jgi:hypothetical protein
MTCTCDNQLQPHDSTPVCPGEWLHPGDEGYPYEEVMPTAVEVEREDPDHPYADELYLGGEGG